MKQNIYWKNLKILNGKDAITLFGETVKWQSYNNIFKTLREEFEKIEEKDINTAFWYRLLDFCDMSKKSKRISNRKYVEIKISL